MKRWTINRLIAIALLVAISVTTIMMISWGRSSSSKRNTTTLNTSTFKNLTGLHWPQKAQLLFIDDKYTGSTGWTGEGWYSVVFKVNRRHINRWLRRPPWSKSNWERGPIQNSEVIYGLFFDNDELATKGKKALRFSPPVKEKRLYYILESGGGKPLEKEGRVFILDPKYGRVWIAIWELL